MGSDRSDAHWSGILSVDLPGRDPHVIKKVCLRRQVVVNTRDGRLRISPHVYSSEEDVNQLIEAIR